MQIKYKVEIANPKEHIVKVSLGAQRGQSKSLKVFLPSWSPGSYLMREYSRNIRSLKVLSSNGEYLQYEQIEKGTWLIDFENSELNKKCNEFTVEYEIYCHELTVRTSHVDESHAFLHGPSYLMGVEGINEPIEIEFVFPPLWSKLHTGLSDISKERTKFIYSAPSYDDLLDCPVEIGCHESDGFMVDGKEHHLIWYGETYPHKQDLKADIKKIVETVSSHFNMIPYESYLFMTHFKRSLYGGLEHKNSTALQFDGRKLGNRMDYINWLALVAHEYFHTWNVKRIRPIELGPFNYTQENYTNLHWLTEGLTSFMDELFVLRSGLCNLEEYLKMQTKNIAKYLSIPGKKFHSLEQASFNAWIKLYRPDENSLNSSVSYYLKGGLVFSTLHFELKKVGKNINDLLTALWDRYLANPEVGVTSDEVLAMIEKIGNKKMRDQFAMRISTTEDIDFESYYKEIGLELIWEQSPLIDLGIEFKYEGDRALIDRVTLDSTAFKAGLNAGDEIIAVNNIRFLKDDATNMSTIFLNQSHYIFTVNRLGTLTRVEVTAEQTGKKLKEIAIKDEKLAKSIFMD